MAQQNLARTFALLGIGALGAYVLIALGVSPYVVLVAGILLLIFHRAVVRAFARTVLAAIDTPWFGQAFARKLTLLVTRGLPAASHSKRSSRKSSEAPAMIDLKSPRDFRDELIQGVSKGILGSMLPHQDARFLPWLLQQSSDDVYVALRCGFNQEHTDVVEIVEHANCDVATALLAYAQAFDPAWLEKPEIYEAGFPEKVRAQPHQYYQFLVPLAVGQRLAEGHYPDSGLVQNLDRFHAKYQSAWEKTERADKPSWLVDPSVFASRKGREADSPYLFGDLHAVYRSKAVEQRMAP